jgi:hypothetical protein
VTSYPAAEWLEVARGERKATWALWARPIETATCLTETGRSTANWAVEKVRQFLGDEWLQKALGGSVNSWMWAPWNDVPHTFRRVIELGARIATVESGRRWRDLKRLARQHANWEDVLLQLEVAAFAVRDGWEAELEPQLPSGKKADLRISRDHDSFLVESTLLGMSERSQEMDRFADKAMSALQTIAFRNGLSVTGELRSVIPDLQLRSWLDEVAATAHSIGNTSLAVVLDVPGGGRIELKRGLASSGQQPGLSGPPNFRNETTRLVRTFRRKARQGAGMEPLWIRLDEGGAIWHLSLPSTWPERREMHEALAQTILGPVDEFPHVAGVVMSEIPMVGTGGTAPDKWTVAGGRAVGVRRPLSYGFGREVVVVAGALAKSAQQLGAWVRWYEQEDSWLDWALAHHQQTATEHLFVSERQAS